MDAYVFSLVAGAVGYAVGSLPLGGLLIRYLTGRDPRDVSPHMLGVENVFRLLGAPAAVGAFSVDILKGFAAVALGLSNPWAALGVYLGHLYSLPLGQRFGRPNGRGNGVLLGMLAGLEAFAGVPLWLAALPVIAYAAVLATSRFVALATLAGLSVLALGALSAGEAVAGLAPVTLALLATGLFRHRTSLARIMYRTEARFGDPPPVRGIDPNTVLAAFMVHPLTLDDLWQPPSHRWVRRLVERGWLPEGLIKRMLPHLRPESQGVITGVRLHDGRELRVMLIGGPLLPEQIREDPDLATRMAIQGARLARELGAEAFGLGAFWSTVGNKGLDVQEAVPEIAITNGGAYTAGTVKEAVPGLLERFQREGGSLRTATAAVVGANGVVAFGVARTIAPEVANLILVGRDEERLERSAATLRRKNPTTRIVTSLDPSAVGSADLIFTATSDPDPVILPDHVKPGAWIFDLGRPADVHPDVREIPGVHLIPGGVVKPPGDIWSDIDIRFGDKMVPACLAETMIMTATRAFERASLGPVTRSADIDFYLREGRRLGFEIVTRDERVAAVEEVL